MGTFLGGARISNILSMPDSFIGWMLGSSLSSKKKNESTPTPWVRKCVIGTGHMHVGHD